MRSDHFNIKVNILQQFTSQPFRSSRFTSEYFISSRFTGLFSVDHVFVVFVLQVCVFFSPRLSTPVDVKISFIFRGFKVF